MDGLDRFGWNSVRMEYGSVLCDVMCCAVMML